MTATPDSSTLSLHDALPISLKDAKAEKAIREYEKRHGVKVDRTDADALAVVIKDIEDEEGDLKRGRRELEKEADPLIKKFKALRSEEHTSELQSRENLVCRL